MTETTTPEVDETPDQTDEKAPETPQEAAEGTETPSDAPEAPPEPVQPADVVSLSRDVVTQTPAGSLTLRPNQKELDQEQHWALKAIGIDTQKDPGVIPHLRAFVHMCQIRALDPFAREAYLIGRGRDNNRKYTMQTGIDGYRKMAKMTGRFIRVKATYWTGAEDDDRSYRMVEVDGDFVMKRVWYDQWPASRGNPGAAKVVIEHYDEDGNITTTDAVADWGMYAPYNDVWEGTSGNRRPKRDADGKPVKELSEMWQKGGPHMLAKCAEALAHRRAFPNAVNGFYVTEEMHRLDGEERSRERSEKSQKRREAFEAAQREQRTATPVIDEEKADDVVDAELVDEPTKADEAVTETVEAIKGDADEARRLLRLELQFQSDVLGQPVRALAKRAMMKARTDLDDLDVDALYPLVNGLRSMVVSAARSSGLPEAEAYAAMAVDGAGPIDVDALGPEDEATTGPDFDPEKPHPFEDDGTGTEDCVHCGLAEDVGPHPEDQK